jgi:hypothetical protein
MESAEHSVPSDGKAVITRRQSLALLGAPLITQGMAAQGIATRGVKPVAKGKPSGLPFHSRLTDVAREAGLTQPVVYGGVDRKTYILETVGCGVAFLDYDNDGWLDIFLLSGTRLEGAPTGATNRLYKNNRDGTFTDVTAKAGLTRAGWASAVAIADYDNDGFEDIFITCWGQNVLYRNNGDGTFTDVTARAGLLSKIPLWGSGCTFLDYDRDGRLDLVIGHYVNFDLKSAPLPGSADNCLWKGVAVNCGPRGLPRGSISLYRNNGDGTFTDVSTASGLSQANASYVMTTVAFDFNNDGWPDIYAACDSSPSLLFRNNHDGTFTETAVESGVAFNEDGREQAGMGLGIGDYNLDGHLDIFKSHFTDDTSILYRNSGEGYFVDQTIASGLGVETRYVGWGAGIVDLDNDGQPDIFLVTGHVYPEVEKSIPAYPWKTPRIVFRNLGNGRFEELIDEAGPGVSAPHSSRGCAFGDFDNDGDIDILVMNMNEPPSLLRNDVSGDNHWLKLKLVGVKSNRSAIGARVTVTYGGKLQVQEVLSQSSFYSSSDRRLHFGLGSATEADVNIRWPGGAVEQFTAVGSGQFITVREGAGIIATERFPANKGK